jgi:asparagine synthase (glutamine-hydrolysing)
MSALAGLWRFDGRTDAGDSCARMLASQAIYGPDACDQWDDGTIALGRRLFRLLPEDVHDHQPLEGAEGTVVLVADLRLDNRDELEAELAIPRGHAGGLSDAAILLAAWERWETECFDRLVGDYAFAVWDKRRRRLVLARDPLGQRPLHYHEAKGFFAFASMPKGLHALPQIPVWPDEDRVVEFLALRSEAGSKSFFKGVERVEPGCFITVTRQGVSRTTHWRPQRRTIRLANEDAYAQALREHLDTAVLAMLRGADGAVGAHLSAGWDSAAVTATAARLLAPTGGRVTAFTSVPRAGYEGPAPKGRLADEGPLSAATAACYPNIEHVLVRSDGRSPLEDLDREAFLNDRPLLNLCNQVWLNAINREAKARRLTVLLTGSMGNLTLSDAGVDWLAELAARGEWRVWRRKARALARGGAMRWRGILAGSFGPWVPGPIWVWLQRLNGGYGADRRDYSAVSAKRLDALEAGGEKARGEDPFYRPRTDTFATRLWAMRLMDSGNLNKGALGGWGVDLRDPTADRRLVEFCLSAPRDQILADSGPRALARRALGDRLPQAVLQASAKGYQAVDWHEGLSAARGDLSLEVERLAACAPAASALDIPRMRRLIEDWPTDGWERPAVETPYRLALLRGISAGHFMRRATGSNA